MESFNSFKATTFTKPKKYPDVLNKDGPQNI
jgi:hypothetical protein